MAENFVNILREIRGNTLAPATDRNCIYGDIKWMYGVIEGYQQITPEERLKLENIEEEATKNSSDKFLLSRENHTGTMSMDYIADSSNRFAMTINDRNKLDNVILDATKNDTDENLRDRSTHTGTQSIDTLFDSSTHVKMTTDERSKLTAIKTNATKNDSDAELRDRSTHTGTQSADTIVDGVTNAAFTNAEKVKLAVLDITKPPAHLHDNETINSLSYGKLINVPTSFTPSEHLHHMNEITLGDLDASRITESSAQQFVSSTEKYRISGSEQVINRGVPNGYAPLDGNGKINPSYLDSLNVIDVFTPVDFEAMLLLSSAKPGDIAYVQSYQDTYMLVALPSSNHLNWKKLNSAAGVVSINGLSGVVSMTSDELPEGVDNKYFTEDRVTNEVKEFIRAGTNVTVSYDSIANELTINANDTSVEWSEIQNKPSPNISVKIAGDASGSANTTLTELASGSIEINNLTLKDTGTAGTYRSVTTDAQGRVIAGANPTTLSGYGIADATPSSHIGSNGTAHDVVTTSVNGFMSSTDKTKLDGIEAGATADQTAAEIKTAYESNNNTNALTDSLLTLLTTKKVKNVSTDALNDKLVITYTDDTVSNLNINDIIRDIHVSGATLDVTTNVLTLTSADGGADVTVDLSDFVNSSELTTALNTAVKLTGNQIIAGVKTFSSNIVGNVTGNSETATKLATARTIGGVSFDGTVNINLPGVNAAGNQSTTGNAGSATKLATARTINGVNFDGTGNIVAPTNLGITAGTTAGPIVTSSSGTNATLPSASATASGVVTTEAQTIAGVKTFTSSPIVPTPTANNDAANKKYVDDKTSTEVYQGSYGLEWNETTDTYRRIGAANYTAIQSMMRRCVLNSDGSVNYYLDKNNSNLKEDGTLAKLDGTDGNVMVEVPRTYVRYEYTTTGGAGTDTVHRWEVSLESETWFEAHWAFDRGGSIRSKRYYPAYLGYVTGGKMISRSGVYPTVSQTLAQFRTAAKANSVNNPSTGQTANGYWGNIDFALYELIALYAVIEYGTMNIQSALGRGRTALSGGAWVGVELIGVNGLSNEYGNRTANYTYVGASTDANADLSFMSYRGCENFFGNVWRMSDGVIFKGTTLNKTMWYSTNPTGYNETGTGYVNSGIVTAAAGGYGRKLANTNKGFIVSDVTGGNSNAGTTDHYYTSATDNTLALVGGRSTNGLTAGPLALNVADSAASLSDASVGCGVAF